MADINAAQELFIVFFAVYFGLTIDRSFKEYKSYDTYSAWKGNRPAIRRLFLSWVVLVILPLVQFSVVLGLLSDVELSLDHSLSDIVAITIICLLSFFEFGYYRIFEAVIYLDPKRFYSGEEAERTIAEERQEAWSHFIPGALYLVVTSLLFLFVLTIQNP
jgi:Na+/H+-dicarboxylate symporter